MSGASGPYAIKYDPKALKELAKLDKGVARRIVRSLDALATNPRPSGTRVLAGFPGLLRLRVGTYRVIYTVKDDELLVLALRIAHRSRAYGNL